MFDTSVLGSSSNDLLPLAATYFDGGGAAVACNIAVTPRSMNFTVWVVPFRNTQRLPTAGIALHSRRQVTQNRPSRMGASRGFRPYIELIRPANVATASADILAGYGIAGLANHAALPWLLIATSCLYAGGIVLNDVFDREIDRLERPERPIPSGRVTARAAAVLGACLLLAGVLAAATANATAGLVAAATAAVVILYDVWGKRQLVFGPLNMGMCRGLNLLLGVSAVPAALPAAWPLALLPVAYITGVTALSRGEVHGGRREVAAFALISLSLVLIALLVLAGRRASPAAALLTVILGWGIVPAFWRAYKTPTPDAIRRAIKAGVLSLAWLDAVLAAAYAGVTYSLIVLGAALIAGRLARLFPVT
jgi:4-hydroxybenzoate polyprenyltransferase